jgi:hypothetical protein
MSINSALLLGLSCERDRSGHVDVKRRIVHALQKYVLNPPLKLLFAIGVVPGLKVREGLRTCWRTGRAILLPGDDPHERQRWLFRQKPMSLANGIVVWLLGTNLLTVRIDLDEPSSEARVSSHGG